MGVAITGVCCLGTEMHPTDHTPQQDHTRKPTGAAAMATYLTARVFLTEIGVERKGVCLRPETPAAVPTLNFNMFIISQTILCKLINRVYLFLNGVTGSAGTVL